MITTVSYTHLSLPDVLRKHKINILPDSRTSYVLGDFLLYQKLPELSEHVTQMTHIEMPDYESIDVDNINSEANAIHGLMLSGILDDFLGEGRNDATFNGRMGTGVFDFRVDTVRGVPAEIHVKNAQCEIAGGFENPASVVIMEAKNEEMCIRDSIIFMRYPQQSTTMWISSDTVSFRTW